MKHKILAVITLTFLLMSCQQDLTSTESCQQHLTECLQELDVIKANDINEDKYPNSKAVIGYDNKLTIGGGGLDLVLQPNTYERLPLTPDEFDVAEVSIGTGSVVSIDYVAILANVKFPTDSTVVFEVRDEAGELAATKVVDIVNGVAFWRLDEQVQSTGVAAVFSLANDGDIELIYMSSGIALEMTQPIYGGHSPIQLNQDTSFTTNTTVKGNFIGRTIESQYGATEYSWRFLDSQWYRDNFIPFRNHALTKPFFIQWRPDYHPEEVGFCWATDDIKASNAGQGTTLVNASMSVECYSGV